MNPLPSQPTSTEIPHLSTREWIERYERLYAPNFSRRRLALERGEGSRVWDVEGREYLDFLTGISVNNLGHCHPRVVEAIRRQAGLLIHCTNIFYIPVQIELAELLVAHSFAERVVFGNSGAEANEAAIKLARRYNKLRHGPGHHEILCTLGSFHGRTMATLSATGQEKIKTHFEPLLEGFRHVPFDDLAAMEAAVGPQTGAIMLELVQGERGVWPADPDYVRGLRRLCDERGLLLIVDEIQTGLGRTGTLFAYEQYGIEPDIMTLAKSLGGGLAMGAMLTRPAIADAFEPGSHGSTMAGNPLTSAAGLAYVSELIEGDWPRRGAEAGAYLRERLQATLEPTGTLLEIRGLGAMIGLDLTLKTADVAREAEEAGLLLNAPAPQTIRLLPPLNVSRTDIDRGVEILAGAVARVKAAQD